MQEITKKKIEIYIETTVPNYLFVEDTLRERDITKDFWKMAKKKYNCFISTLVIDEIERTPDSKRRRQLLNSIEGIIVLPITVAVKKLAELYISKKTVPSKYEPDAMHIAIATLNELDVLVTWNMDHMANPKTRIAVREINEKLGYKVIDIATPEEVISSEKA